MKLAIIGSRTFDNYELLCKEADILAPTEIVSGGAKGADTLAERYAKERNLPPPVVFLPEFRKDPSIPYHPRYFFQRNIEIVTYADVVLAFPEGTATGTRHATDYANKLGKPVYIVTP